MTEQLVAADESVATAEFAVGYIARKGLWLEAMGFVVSFEIAPSLVLLLASRCLAEVLGRRRRGLKQGFVVFRPI